MNSGYHHIISGFLDKTLPKDAWTHAAHLAAAVFFCRKYPPEDTLREMRTAIKTYNEAVGGVNSDTSGYHETLTYFWLETTALFVKNHPSENEAELWQALLQTDAAKSGYPLQFYSRETLFSVTAHKTPVAPDLAPVRDPSANLSEPAE